MNIWQEIGVYVVVVFVVAFWLTIKAMDEDDIWPTGTT